MASALARRSPRSAAVSAAAARGSSSQAMSRSCRRSRLLRDHRRARIDAQLAVRIERGDGVEIGREQICAASCRRRLPDALDALAPFAAAARLRAEKVVAAGAGMGIDHAKSRRLVAQVREDARQHRVLVHVGEVAGMEGVPIIHRFASRLDGGITVAPLAPVASADRSREANV